MVQTAESMRDRQLNIRLSDEEVARLQLVADHYGINVPAVIRMLVKREADAITRTQGDGAGPASARKARGRKR